MVTYYAVGISSNSAVNATDTRHISMTITCDVYCKSAVLSEHVVDEKYMFERHVRGEVQ